MFQLVTSASFLAETSARSPRFFFSIIQKNIFRIKVFINHYLRMKAGALLVTLMCISATPITACLRRFCPLSSFFIVIIQSSILKMPLWNRCTFCTNPTMFCPPSPTPATLCPANVFRTLADNTRNCPTRTLLKPVPTSVAILAETLLRLTRTLVISAIEHLCL